LPPQEFIEKAHSLGISVGVTATSLEEALMIQSADVDFIVMIKTKDSGEDWSTDIQFVPSTKFGEETITDAERWMEEKYGKDNYQIFEFDISDFNGVVGI
jgi:hypothetical protein